MINIRSDSESRRYVAEVMSFILENDPFLLCKTANRTRINRVVPRRAARSARPAVRQTFSARKAAKSADGGGGSDPDGRPPLILVTINPLRFPASVVAFRIGGA